MAIVNIDTPEYGQLYTQWDENALIRAFQTFKLRWILPLFSLVSPKKAFLDVGCARGNFLRALQKRGFTDLHGMDVDNVLYPELRGSIEMHVHSVTEASVALQNKFEAVSVSCMLHHLPATQLSSVARNLTAWLKPGGYVFIYEPNLTSLIGRVFYFYLLRLLPSLYKATMAERVEQEAFCAAWPSFVATLEACGLEKIKHSNWSFYKVFVGKRI